MPKEIVYDQTRAFDVEVTWSREGSHVQIATVVPPAQSDQHPASLGSLLDSWSIDERYLATGLYATLDRDGINRLIRALRRARDQAFGADA